MSKITILPHDHEGGIGQLIDQVPDASTFSKVSDTFQLISDPTRLKILWLLCHSEDCVTNISVAMNMSPPAVSHHLRILKQAGLLVSERQGKEVHYTLSNSKEAELVHRIVDATFEINCKSERMTRNEKNL